MYRVAVFNDTRQKDDHYGCSLVMDNLFSWLRGHDMEATFLWPVAQDWRERREALPPPGAIDAIVVNGEGSIHHDATRPRPGALVDVATLARERYGVPAFLINATLYANTQALYDTAADFTGVYLRDDASRREAAAHGLSARVVPDLTLTLPPPASTAERRGVGVTDSVHRTFGPRLAAWAAREGHPYIPMVVQDTRPPGLGDLADPRAAARRMKRFVKRLIRPPHPRPADAAAFLRWLQGRRLVVTGRYHTVTMCILTRTPFVALESNTPKISWLLDDVFGGRDRVLPGVEAVETLDPARHDSFSAEETARIDAFLARAERDADAMAADIRAAIDRARNAASSAAVAAP